MNYELNTTAHYHVSQIDSLGWELTVCNALYEKSSPCRRALRNDGSYGEQLFHFLAKLFPLDEIKKVLEIGGGLGYVMKDLLTLHPSIQATMLDISPFLLQKQKDTLAGLPVTFVEMDFLNMPLTGLQAFDLVILNEILGDFPTLVVQKAPGSTADAETCLWANKVFDFEEEFSLNFQPNEPINIGAIASVEKLCGARIPFIFISEHSCESSCDHPSFPQMNFEAPGSPEKISLKGHDEYTVKFSHLEKIARAFRYKVIRGQYIDILPVDFSNKLQTAMRQTTSLSDEQEILKHFVYDLYKYEYLVLINESKKKG